MSTDTVLVVADAAESLPACLRAAADAAVALPAPRIEVLHVRIDPLATIEPSEEVLTARYQHEIELKTAAEGTTLRTAFDEWRTKAKPVNAVWTEVQAVPAEAIRERARTAALLVLARRSEATHPAAADGFDTALFDTGKPVLVVPPGIPSDEAHPFGRHLAVGWLDVLATRRSLATLRPWLMAAHTVSVIAIADHDVTLPAEWAAANLPAGASLRTIPARGRTVGAALVEEAIRGGADGLAVGAYRYGRMVEWLLGGVTDHVLHAAPIPVLLHA
jgi:nucleotide-binding universal stress UspA family protein